MVPGFTLVAIPSEIYKRLASGGRSAISSYQYVCPGTGVNVVVFPGNNRAPPVGVAISKSNNAPDVPSKVSSSSGPDTPELAGMIHEELGKPLKITAPKYVALTQKFVDPPPVPVTPVSPCVNIPRRTRIRGAGPPA